MKAILDVSNIIYGGYYASPNFRISGFPLGGIRKLFGMMNADFAVSDFILCFDGGDSFRKELSPQYKAGRVPNYSVLAQVDLLKEMLRECDMPFMYKKGYEADDLICSSVYFFGCIKDPDEITVYSDDRDLSCCVSDKVTVKNTTSNGITITKDNFERRVVRGENVPFNTILLHKMLYGDKSDNYPGINIPGLRFADFALDFTRQLQPFIDNGTFPEAAFMDIDVIRLIIDNLPGSISDDSKEELKKQATLVFPRLTDVTYNGKDKFLQDISTSKEPFYVVEQRHLPIISQGSFDQKKFNLYCSIMGLNRMRAERYGANFEERAEGFRSQLKLRAKELSSGVMAVEKYCHSQAQRPSTTVLENMQLPI